MAVSLSRNMTPTQELVLDCYYSPQRLRRLADPNMPIPEGLERLLRTVVQQSSVCRDDSTEPGSAGELREATLNYIKRVALIDDGDEYRALGLNDNASAQKIESHYRLLLALFLLDKSESARQLCAYLTRINAAYAQLSSKNGLRGDVYEGVSTKSDRVRNVDEIELPVDDVVDEILNGSSEAKNASVSRVDDDPAVSSDAQWAFANNAKRGRIWRARRIRQEGAYSEWEATGVDPATLWRRFYAWIPNKTLLITSVAAFACVLLVLPVLHRNLPSFTVDLDTITVQTDDRALNDNQTLSVEAAGAMADTAAPSRDGDSVAAVATFSAGQQTIGLATQPDILDERLQNFEGISPVFRPIPETTFRSGTEVLIHPRQSMVALAGSGTPVDAGNTLTDSVSLSPRNSSAVSATSNADDAGDAMLGRGATRAQAHPTGAVARSGDSAAVAASTKHAVGYRSSEKIITNSDLKRLLDRLQTAYREGDLDQFVSVFAPHARTNDRLDRVGIADDYGKLFQATTSRQVFLRNLRWEQTASGVEGTGDFTVRIQPKWKSRQDVVAGRITLNVEKADEQVLITGLYHDYQR